MKTVTLTVNGKKTKHELDPKEPLLYVLREEFKLSGAKYGCGLHQCGACVVLVDNQAEPTCMNACESFEGKNIETIEHLSQNNKLHAVQKAFFEAQAAQCGYCLNGMLISAVALLRNNPQPNKSQIKDALQQVICRCGTHPRFIKAVENAISQK
ncbi:(2Fe-2S)-binding protein [Belliella sp. DSM 111904]|uniref:(2Fe-2S)-binding protein n=1 Tax=Belliella filtrata TaxID=2923435 RepID=A0ABS9UXV1_9BACT|nr:(2Fe-2S)-binding protein [Belliella filtrata]MCH7409002.1 (2Fe-2S)-binding protein [Belliella filtrata]